MVVRKFRLLFFALWKVWCPLEQQSGIREECRLAIKALVFSSNGG